MIQGVCAATVTQYRNLSPLSPIVIFNLLRRNRENSSQPEIPGLSKYIEQHLQNQKINLQSLVKKKKENLAHYYFYSLLIKRPPVIPQCFWEYLNIIKEAPVTSECHKGSF